MTTANLSVGIETKGALQSLRALKTAMQNEMKGVVLTLNDTAFTNSIQAALKSQKFTVSINTADIKTQIETAVKAGLAGTHTINLDVKGSALNLPTQQIKTMAAEIQAATEKAASAAAKKPANKVPAVEATEGTDIGYQIKYAKYLEEQRKFNGKAQELNEAGYRAQELAKQKSDARLQVLNETGERQMQYRQIQGQRKLQELNEAGYRAQELAKQRHLDRMNAMWLKATEKQRLEAALANAKVSAGSGNISSLTGIAGSAQATGLAATMGGVKGLEAALASYGNTTKDATKHTLAHAGAMRDAHSAARGLASGFGAMWLTWGNIAPLLAGAALSHGFMQAMKAGSEFAYQLTFVKALGGETAESVRSIGSATLEMSKNGLFGPVEMANGLRTLSQAGLNAVESMKALPVVIDLATVGEMNMKDAAITLVGVMTAFNLDKTDFGKIGDVFAKAAAVSQTSVEQMTQAMKTASVVGEQYGASMGDTATALTLLAKMNITGTAAGTSLRNMLKELYSPVDKSAKVMKELGLSAQTAEGNLRPFPDVIFDLKTKIEQFNKASQVKILQTLFGERGAKEAVAMLSLTREEWVKLNETISDSSGFMREVSAELEGTVKGSFRQAINTLQVSLIEAYDNAEGAAGKLAGQLKETFGSTTFKDGLTAIVSGVVTLTNALVAMAPALTLAAGGWIALRAAMIGASIWTSVSAALGGATLALQTMGAVAAGTATTLTGSSGLLAAARLLPGAMGAAGASILATTGVLGPLAIAIGVAGAAWYLFRDRTVEAMQQSAQAVAQNAASMKASLANILRDVHNLPAEMSRKAMDAQRQTLVEGQGRLLEQKESLKNKYGIKSDAEADEFIRQSTTTNSTGDIYTKTGDKYDAVTAYLKSKEAQKQALQAFARVNATVESVAATESKPTAAPVSGTKDWTGDTGGGRGSRAARDAENSQVQALEARYRMELRTADAHYGKLEKLESASAQYGIKTKEEAEIAIDKITKDHMEARLSKVEELDAQMAALLKNSPNLSDADKTRAKAFIDAADEEIRTLREKLDLLNQIADLKSQGVDVSVTNLIRNNNAELSNDYEKRKQAILGKIENPVERSRSEGRLAAETKYKQAVEKAQSEVDRVRKNGDAAAIAASEDRLNRIRSAYEEEASLLSDLYAKLTEESQTASYGWTKFWEKYASESVTASETVQKALESTTKNMEDALSEMFKTGKFGWKSMIDAILGDLGRLLAKLAVADLGRLVSGQGSNSNTVLSSILGGLGGGSKATTSGAGSATENWIDSGGLGGGSSSSWLGTAFSAVTKWMGFANGGIMTSRGSLPLQMYSSGGVANSPQLALYGEGRTPEAYVPLPDGRSIPVNMKGGNSGPNININIHSSKGDPAEIKRAGAAAARSVAGAVSRSQRYA